MLPDPYPLQVQAPLRPGICPAFFITSVNDRDTRIKDIGDVVFLHFH